MRLTIPRWRLAPRGLVFCRYFSLFFFFFLLHRARSRRKVDTPNEFSDDVSLINCLRMVFPVTEVVMVVRHQWMGDLVFARDGEPVFKGDVTVFPTLYRKHESFYWIRCHRCLPASGFFFQGRTSLSCLVKEFGIYIPHIRG